MRCKQTTGEVRNAVGSAVGWRGEDVGDADAELAWWWCAGVKGSVVLVCGKEKVYYVGKERVVLKNTGVSELASS